VELPCTGMVPPSLLDFMLRRGGADGVFLTGCGDGECFHRLGGRWVEERLDGTRETYLRTKFSKKRIRLDWASSADGDRLKEDIIAFRDSLPGLPDESDLVETNGVDET